MTTSNINQTKIVIDSKSGFCFGVSNAIKTAEEQLQKGERLDSIGDIVHNEEEIKRLKEKGLKSIALHQVSSSTSNKILFRAHGEPPSSYKQIKDSGKELIDATCPVVLKLQQRIKKAWMDLDKTTSQIVIYGKKNHAEVIGLSGQTNNEAIVVQTKEDLNLVDKNKHIILFSQTTMSHEGLKETEQILSKHLNSGKNLRVHKTICAQVGNRVPHLEKFAKQYKLVIFVGGKKSSNGKVLYNVCRAQNPETYFVSEVEEVQPSWFNPPPSSIGICGATSTPKWLMENVAEKINTLLTKNK